MGILEAAAERVRVGGFGEFGGAELDDVFSILSNSRRRHIIRLLENRPEPWDLRQLAETIGAIEVAGTLDGEQCPTDVRKAVYNSLHQRHLKELDRHGILTYHGSGEPIVPLRPIKDYAELLAIADRAIDDEVVDR